MITSDVLARASRFAFMTAIFQHHHETLLGTDSLDDVAEDAIQSALAGEDSAARLISLCIKSSELFVSG